MCLRRCSSVRVFARTSAHFSRNTSDGLQHIDGHFTSYRQMVSSAQEFVSDLLRKELKSKTENFNCRVSGFVLDLVYEFTLVITKFRPLAGSSYIPTFPAITKKHATVNVKTEINVALSMRFCLVSTQSTHTQIVLPITPRIKAASILMKSRSQYSSKIFPNLNPSIPTSVSTLFLPTRRTRVIRSITCHQSVTASTTFICYFFITPNRSTMCESKTFCA